MDDETIAKLPAWLRNVLALAGGAFLLWLLFIGYTTRHAREAAPRYTIGHVTRTSYAVGPSSHSVVFFTYQAGGTTYRSSSPGELADGCTRCLVKYAANDPENAEFYNQVCVPDSITEVPATGWERPPVVVPAGVE